MTKKKANVTPDDVGTFYIDGNEHIYQLLRCATEPVAVMSLISENTSIEKPISEFANFVRLKPEHPIKKPLAPRKVRVDKGTHREKQAKVAANQAQKETMALGEAAITAKASGLAIHTPSLIDGDNFYRINIAGSEATGLELRTTALKALRKFGGVIPIKQLTENQVRLLEAVIRIEKEDNNE